MISFQKFRELYEQLLITEAEAKNTHADKKVWEKWRKLINMSAKEIEDFYNSDDGKDAGMKKGDADKAGIDSGRESARMLMKMIPIGSSFSQAEKNWTPTMWRWCRKQNSFNSRMKGMRSRIHGNPFEKNGKKTRWLKSMLIWGHDPRKPLRKV